MNEKLVALKICNNLPKTWAGIKGVFSAESNMNTNTWGHSKYYTEYFNSRNDIGGFDKALVARKVVDKIMSLSDSDQKELIKLFGKLIANIWQQEPIWS